MTSHMCWQWNFQRKTREEWWNKWIWNLESEQFWVHTAWLMWFVLRGVELYFFVRDRVINSELDPSSFGSKRLILVTVSILSILSSNETCLNDMIFQHFTLSNNEYVSNSTMIDVSRWSAARICWRVFALEERSLELFNRLDDYNQPGVTWVL